MDNEEEEVQGASGTQGARGLDGGTGVESASGVQGASAVQGASGVQGATGGLRRKKKVEPEPEEPPRALDGISDELREGLEDFVAEILEGMQVTSHSGVVFNGTFPNFTVDVPQFDDVPDDFVVEAGGVTAASVTRRRWRIIDDTDYEADPIVPTVHVEPNGASVRPDFTFRNSITITDITTPITLAANTLGYLKMGALADEMTVDMVFDTNWTNDEPFRVDAEVPSYPEFYYPIFQCLAYDADRATEAYLNFPDQDLQVFDLAEDASLVATTDYWLNPNTYKGYAVQKLVAAPDDFYAAPTP